jgi:mitogen-activated protein kinase kinase kinase
MCSDDARTIRSGFYLAPAPTKPRRWTKGDALGAGSFGRVFLGLNSETGELFAVKEVAVTDATATSDDDDDDGGGGGGGADRRGNDNSAEAAKRAECIEQLEQEVTLLSRLQHPNIVRYIGTERSAEFLYIFLEYVPGGSIASLLERFGRFEESVMSVYTRQILIGLDYLHAQRTVHRDIKGANILVEKSGRIKLADFGMAKTLVERIDDPAARARGGVKGSAYWMAPEVIRQKGHGSEADVWAVGCTVLEMATGKPPWSHCSGQVQVLYKIASTMELPEIPSFLSPDASEFVLLCLQRDPESRPAADRLLTHAFASSSTSEVEVPALQYEGYWSQEDVDEEDFLFDTNDSRGGSFGSRRSGSGGAGSGGPGVHGGGGSSVHGVHGGGNEIYDPEGGVHGVHGMMSSMTLRDHRGGGGSGSYRDFGDPHSALSSPSHRSARGHRRQESGTSRDSRDDGGGGSRHSRRGSYSDLPPPPKVEDWRIEVENMTRLYEESAGDGDGDGGEMGEFASGGGSGDAFRVGGLLQMPPLKVTPPRPGKSSG